MKGYVVVLTEKVTGKKLYMAQEMDNSDNVGITWPTENFKEVRIYFNKKDAETEIPYFKSYHDNYDTDIVPVDITSPNLPNKDFGISTIKQVEDLCNAALQEKKVIHLLVSQAEDLSKVFPNAKCKNFGSTMVRLNDAELFSKLFNRNVTTVEEAFAISQKPLNLNEFA
jgi:hypothetical protein